MINLEGATLENLSIHFVGNKTNSEGVILSTNGIKLDEKFEQLFRNYFSSSFKGEEYFNFHHENNLSFNEIYNYVSNIFENEDEIHDQSINIAKHLYEKSEHPKIKSGEFYVAYLKDCIISGKVADAVGIFKTETKETFLKIYHSAEDFEVESQEGINISKLDKGCLILNSEKENGYIVAIVDKTNKGIDAKYWIDDFLHVRQRKDEYYNTNEVITLYKDFVTKELPSKYDVSKADQADLLNKSVKYFKEQEEFDIDAFSQEVIAQPEIIESFNEYKNSYQQEHEIDIADSFNISDSAVKKQARKLKSVIKLDKNFHIYVHGDQQMIQKGYDESTGMHYYQLYFKEEL